MQTEFLSPDVLYLTDVRGIPRKVYGCSLYGLQEFYALLDHIGKILESVEESTILADLYRDNSEFQFCCDECLRLNGIDPAWVNFKMMSAMLFEQRTESGEFVKPALIRLNQPSRPPEPSPDGESLSAIAALLKVTGSLKDSLDIARNEPWKQVVNAVDSVPKTDKQGKPKDPRDRKAVLASLSRDFSRLSKGVVPRAKT